LQLTKRWLFGFAGAHGKEQTLSIHVLAGRAARKPKVQPVAVKPRSAELLDLVLATLDDAKAEDVVSIDVAAKTSIADHMVVASGRSQRHVGAIADQIEKKLREMGYSRIRVEGLAQCDWVLVDAGDVIVHLFEPDVRNFYNLEKMWLADRPLDVVPS
jgi:ribosome-associated protein